MANTGKYVSTPQAIADHAAALAALASIPPDIKAIFFFEAGEVAALLRVDTKTLQRKRKERDAALAEGTEINPIDIASIPYVPPTPVVRYSAREIEEFLLRLASAASEPTRPFGLTRSVGASFMGFQAWMAIATPTDDWPFSIDSDGRPMDMCAAITLGVVTGVAERLTLREFAERIADSAGKAFQEREKEKLKHWLASGDS